jgi:hypothetical protein
MAALALAGGGGEPGISPWRPNATLGGTISLRISPPLD